MVFAGSKARPRHAHFDKGGFHIEVDGEAAFVDRGMVRYDDPRLALLKRTENHNTLAPSFDGITTVEQEGKDPGADIMLRVSVGSIGEQ
ncbi:MAG: heparinase II/III family protein [Spartobacteria bacterium]